MSDHSASKGPPVPQLRLPLFPWNEMIDLTAGDGTRGVGISLAHLSLQMDRIIELLEALDR